VSIGATLAAARRRAGFTIGEVSQRTRVTEPIIQGIEQDDYAACGGDFYARGHIRAIAQAVGEDPSPLIDEFDATWRSAAEITAAEVFSPAMPLRKRERRRVRWTAFLAALVLVVLGFASYKFVSGVGRTQPAAAASPRPSPAGGQTNPPASAAAAQASATQSSPVASPSSTSPIAVQALAPASVAAFGPAGLGDGDDPQRAALAIDGDPARPWISQWYATARFGALKSGTGLLLDMGRTVTVASVRISLTSHSGADIRLRAGSKPVPAWLHRVATASNAGGTVRLQPGSPVRVRYVLIWFTKLPPDNTGNYQAGVYRITVQGHR